MRKQKVKRERSQMPTDAPKVSKERRHHFRRTEKWFLRNLREPRKLGVGEVPTA